MALHMCTHTTLTSYPGHIFLLPHSLGTRLIQHTTSTRITAAVWQLRNMAQGASSTRKCVSIMWTVSVDPQQHSLSWQLKTWHVLQQQKIHVPSLDILCISTHLVQHKSCQPTHAFQCVPPAPSCQSTSTLPVLCATRREQPTLHS